MIHDIIDLLMKHTGDKIEAPTKTEDEFNKTNG